MGYFNRLLPCLQALKRPPPDAHSRARCLPAERHLINSLDQRVIALASQTPNTGIEASFFGRQLKTHPCSKPISSAAQRVSHCHLSASVFGFALGMFIALDNREA
jgi:hypothetical protein